MNSSSDVQLYPERRLGLGAQQGNLDRYSYSAANSHRSCVDQGDHNKVQVGPELIRPNQDVNPMRGLWRIGSVMVMKSSLFNCA